MRTSHSSRTECSTALTGDEYFTALMCSWFGQMPPARAARNDDEVHPQKLAARLFSLRKRQNISVEHELPRILELLVAFPALSATFEQLASATLSHLPQVAQAVKLCHERFLHNNMRKKRVALSDSWYDAIKISSCGSSRKCSRNTSASALWRPKRSSFVHSYGFVSCGVKRPRRSWSL